MRASTAQEKGLQENRKTSVENEIICQVPFELTAANNIAVEATINGIDKVRLMFHTANSHVVLTSEATKKKATSVKFDKSVTMSSWGGNAQGRISDGNSLQIGTLNWGKLRVFEDLLSGQTTDGKFGPDLFGGKVFEIDFDAKMLRVHSGLPAYVSGYEKLTITEENGMMFLTGSVKVGGKLHENKFLIHSGYGGSVLLDDEFVQANELKTKLKTLSESELRDSGGNVLKTRKVQLPMFKVGSFEIANVPTQIFDGAIRKQKMSVVGGDFLKRFNIIVDAENTCIYLRRNELFESDLAK